MVPVALTAGNLTGGVIFVQRRGDGLSLLVEGRPRLPSVSSTPPPGGAGGLSGASGLDGGQPAQ